MIENWELITPEDWIEHLEGLSSRFKTAIEEVDSESGEDTRSAWALHRKLCKMASEISFTMLKKIAEGGMKKAAQSRS